MKPSIVAAVAFILFGCAVNEDVEPRPITQSAPAIDGGPGEAGDAGVPPSDAGLPKRTVMQRNPFGNVGATDNLLWDGDFELSSPFTDEYSWLVGPPYAFGPLPDVRIGAQCRSGIKCVALAKGKSLIGIGVGSKDHALHASLWAKIAMGSCSEVGVILTNIDASPDADAMVGAISEAPDSYGFCHYDGVTPPRIAKTAILVHNKTGAPIIVDDAVLLREPVAKSLTSPNGPLEPSDADAIARMRSDLRERRGPQDRPKNDALRAFEAPRP